MLHDKSLPKNPGENFKDIEGKINSSTESNDIANIIAKYREDMISVLKSNEAEGVEDETKLNDLKNKLEEKKATLEAGLGTTGPLNLTNNDGIVNFWKGIVDNSSLTGATKANNTQKTDLNNKITELINKIQFLHAFERDDGTIEKIKDFRLFKGESTDITNFEKTLKNPIIKTLLDEDNPSEVENDVNTFVNSMKHPDGNAFYIRIADKLFNDEQGKIAMRIALYLYCLKKLINDDKLTEDIYNNAKNILENQIKKEEIPRIKGLHNTKKELGYISPEHETLRDLNAKSGDIDLGDKDITTSFTEIQNLTANFENGTATGIEKYEIDKNLIKLTDADGNPLSVSFTEASGRNLEKLFSNINDGEKTCDMHINIGGTNIKVGKLILDNTAGDAKLDISLDDLTSITGRATAAGIMALPKFPLNLEIRVKGIKDVKNKLKGCKASLTKTCKITLTTGVITPPLVPLTPPLTNEQRERESTITNVEQVNRAIAEREADEELRERYRHVGWNIFDRANLLLRRKFIKDKIVRKKMKGTPGIVWSSSPDLSRGMDWKESGEAAAHRHQIEEKENLSDSLKVIADIDEVNYPETRNRLDDLINDFTGMGSTPPRTGGITPDSFKTRFMDIMEKSGEDFDTGSPNPINKIIESNNLELLSTNLMMQAEQFQAHQKLVYSILDHINHNPGESDAAFDTFCRAEIENYIGTYSDIPDFLHQMGLSLDKENDIKTLKASTGALAAIQAQSLKYRLQILNGGDEAYNVKKGKGWVTKAGRLLDDPTDNTKLGKRLEKHPAAKETFGWIRGATKLAVVPTTLFFASMGPLATAGFIGGVSGLTALLNKKSHYEKEHRSYQRMQATNLTDYRNKRTNLANEVAGMKRYEGRFWGKKKRTRDQFRDYVAATQDQLELTNDLTASIMTNLKKGNLLTPYEKDELGKKMADGLARLDFHKDTGQNFLGSNNYTVAEKEYKLLQKAIIGGTLRLGIDVNDLRTRTPYSAYYNNVKGIIMNGTGSGDKYNTQGYLKARKRFKKRSNLKAIDSALMTGGISFGLSYLASSLASRDQVNKRNTLTTKSSGNYGGEYNPGDVDESLLITGSSPTGSINPEMYAHINGNTAAITKCQLYSSVDALKCSAKYGASELARTSADLTASLKNPVISGNHDLVSAIHNYITDVKTKVGMIPGLDAGNHDLLIARGYEALNKGILDEIITSGNTSLTVNPTGFTWVNLNGSVQASGTGAVGQSFRNMGIVGLDYIEKGTEETVKHVTRAIAIPVGLNTFGSPESDPK